MGLTINQDKTRVVNLGNAGASLDFLGYTFRYDRDLHGRDHRYLNVFPSKKSLARERAVLREMTSSRMCFKPIPRMIGELNKHLRGWSNYFGHGYSRRAMREINYYTRLRLMCHLSRRSQRPWKPPKGTSHYAQFAKFGLVRL